MSIIELEALREELSNLDKELMEILEERFALCEEIGEIKREENIPIEDSKQEALIIQSNANSTSLNKEFVKNLFSLIFEESKSLQAKNGKTKTKAED